MSPRWTREEYQAHLQKQMATKPSKYKAVKTVVDGITFASKKEAQRYHELKLMEQAGLIEDLQVQPELALDVCDVRVGIYRGDFSYYPCHEDGPYKGAPIGPQTIEDVKGMKTPVYQLKKKLVEAIYGITIRET
jgi:hypothetical protein